MEVESSIRCLMILGFPVLIFLREASYFFPFGLSFQEQIIGLSKRHGSAAPWFEGGTQRGKDPETEGLEGDGMRGAWLLFGLENPPWSLGIFL